MSVMEEATETTPNDNKGDEQVISPELSDPAILAVNPKFRYGKDELLKLRDAPLSQRKPDFLDITEVSPAIFDSTRWNLERKKSSDTPIENGSRAVTEDHRRRSGDPRERLRKENDGIVLSPQRRSFNSGCCVPSREPRNTTSTTRPHSPLSGSKPDTHLSSVSRDMTTSRRIGSGRILRDNWDFTDKLEATSDDYNFRPQTTSSTTTTSSSRTTFNNNYEKEKERRSNNRFNDRRRINNDARDEEPEWFSSGPLSQNDTIELRGFDDATTTNDRQQLNNKKKLSPSQAKRARDWFRKKTEIVSLTEEKEEIDDNGQPDGRSTPQQEKENSEKEMENDTKKLEKNLNEQFEDILKSDTLSGLLTNGVGCDGDNSKSRFSKWFKTIENDESRRSSIQDDTMIKNLLKDLNEPNVSIPDDSTYFAPISPAANTNNNLIEMLQRNKMQQDKQQIAGRILNLNEIEAKMIHVTANEPKQPKTEEDMSAFSRLLANITTQANGAAAAVKSQPLSLMEMLSRSQQMDEAHARMNQLLGPTSPNDINAAAAAAAQRLQQQKQVEMLSKLMNTGMQVRASPLPEMSLQQSRELLNRPEAQAILQGLKIGDITPQHLYQQLANPALQPRHREMLVTILKLQQQQQQQQGGATASNTAVGPSPRLSPVPPHHMFQQQQAQQQQQQLRVSPLPPNAYCVSPIMATSPNTLTVPALHQRIPSPRELQVHTQNILQRALIKKKLEEQQENYRKKQEMQQRGQSPNNNTTAAAAATTTANNQQLQQTNKSVSSPTPLAFTPTSVLRKMTAEKDESKDGTKLIDGVVKGRPVTGMRSQQQTPSQQPSPQPQQQWPQQQYPINLKQAGRPIVKANNFQQQPEFFNQQQQQQKFLNQLQAQRKQYHHGAAVPPQYANPTNQFSQLTQQQLRAQHQQHARPVQQQQPQPPFNQQQQQQGNGSWQQFLNPPQNRGQVGRGNMNDGDLSPTSNQLTRWFSPDLLERARVGELPSTATVQQHLLSLEEIERLTAPPVHN